MAGQSTYVDGKPVARGDYTLPGPVGAPHDPILDDLRYFMRDYSDFTTFNDEDWTIAGDATVSTVNADTVDGILELATAAGTDNHEAYLSKAECWDLASGNELYFEARVRLTEANTDDANIIVGLTDQGGANTLVDNGAGPPASYDGAVFFKVDGTMDWQTETSLTTTQETNTEPDGSGTLAAADRTDFASDTWYTLGIAYNGKEGAVYFYIDDVLISKHETTLPTGQLTVTFGVKNGGANVETLDIDYYFCRQRATRNQ